MIFHNIISIMKPYKNTYRRSMFLLGLVLSASVTYAGEKQLIGSTTLVIGKVYLEQDGQRKILRTGGKIAVGDKITTLNNGHAHIQFTDQGIISVRPNSQLDIEHYRFNKSDPSQSTVKFNLIRGIVRSVSGKAAKSARDRFRMNTPIAAIGVRGTDFVVRANSDKIQAFVNEGAIVVSPFSSQCSAASLGPCAINSVELHGNSNQLLELNSQQAFATIRAANGEVLPALLYQPKNPIVRKKKADKSKVTDLTSASESASAKEESTKSLELSPLESEKNTVDAAGQDNINQDVDSQPNEPATGVDPQIQDSQESLENDVIEIVPEVGTKVTAPETNVIDSTLTTEFSNASYYKLVTPVDGVTEEVLDKRQLVWGRWANISDVNDKISVAYDTAVNGRRISVGSNEVGLFRQDDGKQLLAENLGKINFNLELADIDYVTAIGASQMAVENGYLTIDFNNNEFSTALSLQENSLGEVSFSASGTVSKEGFFTSKDANNSQILGGAVSFDGKEAGYLFEKKLSDGTIKGTTLWGKQ